MKTKSLKSAVSIVLAAIMLMLLVPLSAMAVTYGDDGNITSTYFTLNNFAYGNTVISATVSGETSIAFVDGTTFYESTKTTPTCKEDLTETTDVFLQAGKQYFCAIEFSEHFDLYIGVTDPDDYIYFDSKLTATLTCNGVSCEQVLDLSENRRVFVYKLPILEVVPYGIDVTTVIEQGGNVAPTTGAFELEVLNFEDGSNFPIDTFTIGGKNISTNGTGSFNSKLTIGSNDYEKLYYLANEGIFVKQKKGNTEGWTYDESVWFVQLHHEAVVNALGDDVETMPNIKFDCYKGKITDGTFSFDSDIPAEKVTFTNIYTENIDPSVTVKIPFVKKVTLGGDIAPTDETFKFEIFNIGNGNSEEYADVTYTAEVTANGEGEFNGEIVITGPESQVGQYICEGFFVREVKGDAANWTYSDTVWYVIPEWNDDQQREFVVYPTVKEESDNGIYYEIVQESAEKMIFENIYTEDKAVEPPQTGDNGVTILLITLVLVSGFGIAVANVIGKKKSDR